MGEFGLGKILGMGSKGNMVSDYLACLCYFTARKIYAGLAGKADCLSFDHWIFGGSFYIFWCKSLAGITQLRLYGIMIFP